MTSPRLRPRLGGIIEPGSWIISLPIAGVLVLAGLQLRSVVRMRDADVAHLRRVVREGTEGVAWDFNHQLARAYDWFSAPTLSGDPWDAFATKYAVWQARAPHPALFRAWYVVTDDGSDGLVLRRFDPASGHLVPAAWSDELAPVQA